MRLRWRAPASRTATTSAAQLPLRAQALVLFAVSLALVVALAALGPALIARQAVDRGLRAQADTAHRLVGSQLAEAARDAAAEAGAMRSPVPRAVRAAAAGDQRRKRQPR